MEEEEHEVYGGDIPDEGEMEGDMDSHGAHVDMAHTDEEAIKVSVLFPLPLLSVFFFVFLFSKIDLIRPPGSCFCALIMMPACCRSLMR